jgi:hypothetical protein
MGKIEAIEKANKGGTAFPICLYSDEFVPSKIKLFGKD